MMKNKRKGNGFTLIELLVTMAIMVGVVFAAGGAIMLLTRSMDTTNQLTLDNSAARLSMMRLTREARSATMVRVEPPEGLSADAEGNYEAQHLYLYFAEEKTKGLLGGAGEEMWIESGTVVLYYRNPETRQLARREGTYQSYFDAAGKLTIARNMNVTGVDTGLEIRRFSARVDYEGTRGWLYIRIRADQAGDSPDSPSFDQNLMLDTKIALNRLIT